MAKGSLVDPPWKGSPHPHQPEWLKQKMEKNQKREKREKRENESTGEGQPDGKASGGGRGAGGRCLLVKEIKQVSQYLPLKLPQASRTTQDKSPGPQRHRQTPVQAPLYFFSQLWPPPARK